MRITNPTMNAVLTAFASFIDGSTNNGTMDFYTGSPAASAGSPPGGTLLGTVVFSRPSFQLPSGGSMLAYAVSSETNAVAGGNIGCFVIKNSSGTICGDGTVSGIGGGGDLEFDDVAVAIGDTIAVNSLRIYL